MRTVYLNLEIYNMHFRGNLINNIIVLILKYMFHEYDKTGNIVPKGAQWRVNDKTNCTSTNDEMLLQRFIAILS